MPAIFKKADQIEEQLLEMQDRLSFIKSYKDIGLTIALRKKVNKDIYLLKTKLSRELIKIEGK